MRYKSIISSLSNYTTGVLRVRLNKLVNQVTPNAEHLKYQAENANFYKMMYTDKITSIISNNAVPARNDAFSNLSANCHFIGESVNLCKKKLESFTSDIQFFLYHYEETNKNAKVDISLNLKKIENILSDYSKDPDINQHIEFLQKKYDAMLDFEYAIKITSQEICNFKNKPNQYNPNLNENIQLKPIKDSLEKIKEYYPELCSNDRKKKVYDINPLINYYNQVSVEMELMYNKMREAGMKFCLADEYLDVKIKNKLNGHSVLDFLTDKINEGLDSEYAPYRVLEINNSRYKEIMMFKDQSLLIKTNKNEFIEVMDNKQVIDVIDTLLSESVRQEFNKNPQIAKDVLKIIRDCEVHTFSNIDALVDTYKQNFEILRSKNYNILKAYKETDGDSYYQKLEKIDDEMNKIVKEHKVYQFAHSISSNKYNHLYNEESYKIIREIYDIGLKESLFQDYIGKKIAAYKTTEAFNEGLRKFNAMFNDFNPTATLNKVEACGARIVTMDEKLIIVEIEEYAQSKVLGSTAWCIVREEGYFDSYTCNGKHQYIAFDFTKNSTNIESMIGITLNKDGSYHAAHYKDDGSIFNDDENLLELISIIEENNEILDVKQSVNMRKKLWNMNTKNK